MFLRRIMQLAEDDACFNHGDTCVWSDFADGIHAFQRQHQRTVSRRSAIQSGIASNRYNGRIRLVRELQDRADFFGRMGTYNGKRGPMVIIRPVCGILYDIVSG